jgi:arylsulfatase A-like enzyme
MIDLPATLCDFAETSFVHPHFGRSLRPVLADPTQPHRQAAYSEGGFRLDEEPQNERPEGHPYQLKGALQHEQPELVGRAVSVRTREWTFIYRSQEQDELYDRQKDPHELSNLAPDPAYDGVCRQLRDQLFGWLVETSDVIPYRRDARMEPALFDQLIGSHVASPPARGHAGPERVPTSDAPSS